MTTDVRSPKILIVDDDATQCAALAALLSDAGYDTFPASTVPAASEMPRQAPPDLLITDVRMDGYNGLQLAAMNERGIPVIVLTGFADRATELEAERFGATFQLKPVSPNELLQVVASRLAKDED